MPADSRPRSTTSNSSARRLVQPSEFMPCASPPRIVTCLTEIVLVAPVLASLLLPAFACGQSGDVVISQIYAGGRAGVRPSAATTSSASTGVPLRSPSTTGPSNTPRQPVLPGAAPRSRERFPRWLLARARGHRTSRRRPPQPRCLRQVCLCPRQWSPRAGHDGHSPLPAAPTPAALRGETGCDPSLGHPRARKGRQSPKTAIALEFGVSDVLVHYIATERCWRDAPAA